MAGIKHVNTDVLKANLKVMSNRKKLFHHKLTANVNDGQKMV